MSKNFYNFLSVLSFSALSIGTLTSSEVNAFPANFGVATIQLYGVLDMDDKVPYGSPHYLDARLMGSTTISMTGSKHAIYDTKLLNGAWNRDYALVGFSDYGLGRCRASTFSVADNTVLGEGKKFAFVMTNSVDPSLKAYIVPSLKVDVSLQFPSSPATSGLQRNYSGYLLEPIPGLVSVPPNGAAAAANLNLCMIPPGQIVLGAGGGKTVQFSIGKPLEVYLNKDPIPGNFIMTRSNYNFVTLGGDTNNAADGTLGIKFVTNIKVARVCRISAASGAVFNEVFGNGDSIPLESRLTYTCSGPGNPLFMSAIPRVGTVADSTPAKLDLEQIDAGEVSNVKPWVIGAPYLDGMSVPALSCNNTTQGNLIKFDNSDLPLNRNSKTGIDNLNIRWLMCKNDQVKPGKYKGRVELLVYTKV